MKLERISSNQIKYSITFEELNGKGFVQEEMFKESYVWDDLFDEMLHEASKIYELETYEAVSVEIFSLTSKELVLILTLDEDEMTGSSMIDEKKRKRETGIEIFAFSDIEDCIQLAKTAASLLNGVRKSSLFAYKDNYYLIIEVEDVSKSGFWCICEEYGDFASFSQPYLEEYGKLIIKDSAISTLDHYF